MLSLLMHVDEYFPLLDLPIAHSSEGRRKPFCSLNRHSTSCSTFSRSPQEFIMREAGLAPKLLQSLNAIFTQWFPIRGCKIDRFVEVEAMVESCMISLGKCNGKLPCSLI